MPCRARKIIALGKPSQPLTEAIPSELVAVSAVRRAPRLLDIWALLPQTNCKQCGEATCMAFAAALLKRDKNVSECPLLASDPVFIERQSTLESML
jgi:ArsR family metal-binding transcriptional regulator